MKITILLLVISVLGRNECKAQLSINYINGSAEFQKTIEFENTSAIDLYALSNEWVISAFNSPGDVVKSKFENQLIQVEGLEPGIVLFTFPRTTASLKYILNIETRNNTICFTISKMEVLTELKNKYTLEEYVFEKDGRELTNKQAKRVKDHATRVANVLINSFETFLAEKAVRRKWD